KEHPRAIAKEEPPRLDLFSFSLLSVSKTGAPNPTRDPIQIISWRKNGNTNNVILTRADSDQNTIQKFGEDITKINPDFVLSFETSLTTSTTLRLIPSRMLQNILEFGSLTRSLSMRRLTSTTGRNQTSERSLSNTWRHRPKPS